MDKKTRHNGLIGTIVFHGIIVAILFLLGFHTPLPLPDEEGILVSFGNNDAGQGDSAPIIKKNHSPKTSKPIPKIKEVAKNNNAPKIITQNLEDAPAVKSGNKKIDLKKKKEEERIRKQKELERKRIAEERRKKAEEERIRKEKEAKRKAEEERKRKFAESISSKAKNIFKDSKQEGKGYGNKKEAGNQGKQNGKKGGDYNGTGLGDSGISYSLEGRNAEYIHKPNISFDKGGKVVVEIIVNSKGLVIRATPGAIGTTTSDRSLNDIAKKSALKTRFNSNDSSSNNQKGTITYVFVVN